MPPLEASPASSASSAPPIPALEVHGLRAGYGRIEVLHGIDLVVPRGSVVALLGPNGAGKTTLLNTIAGFIEPTAGCVHVAGVHVNQMSPQTLARAGVCSVPEGRGIFPNLTVLENLRVFTHATDVPYKTVVERACHHFPVLGERREQLAGTLSGGERQMLAMSRAFATEPAVLLIDEISMGLAPLVVKALYNVVSRLTAEGISVLLVEQFAAAAMGVADYVAIMRLGRIEMLGEPADVADHVTEAYMSAHA